MNAVLPGTTMGRTQIYPLLFTALCTIALTFCSCTDEPSGPAPPTTPDTTSHEFVWEVDTLFFKGTTQPVYFQAKAFYGTSASNVYMGGYTTGGDEMTWHWDGMKWENIDMSRNVGRDVADVDGVDSSFVVFLGYGPGHPTIGSASGIVALENGVLKPLPLPLGTRWRTCLHVVSRDEIYLGGVEGVQRYNGTKWEWMLDTNNFSGSMIDIYKFNSGALELTSQQEISGTTMYRLWRWANNEFTVADSFAFSEQGMANIRFGYRVYSNGNSMYSVSKGGVFERINGAWEKILTQGGSRIAGVSNNLMVTGGNIVHFNGSTWKDLFPEIKSAHPNIQLISGIYYQQGTFFIVVREDDNAVVFRGTEMRE